MNFEVQITAQLTSRPGQASCGVRKSSVGVGWFRKPLVMFALESTKDF